MSESKQFLKDPTGLAVLPLGSVRVEDPEEEVFLLYTALSTRKPQDISSSSSFPGLGSVDSRQDKLTVSFTIPPPRSKPLDLENSEAGHVSKSKKSSSRPKRVEEARTLEIELVQDKTTLRSKRGDTGSVLWRVSVALGQAVLNDLSSEAPNSLFDPEKLKNCNVLELGAGTGLLSLIFAPWVRHYTVTDLDYLVPLIRKNVCMNLPVVQKTLKPTRHFSSSPTKWPKPLELGSNKEEELLSGVTVGALDWMELLKMRASPLSLSRLRMSFRLSHADPPDLIVISDCVYNPSLLPALLATVEYYAESDRTCVLVAVELRSADVVREFLQLWLNSATWEVWRVGSRHGDESNDSNDDGWLGIDFAVWVGWRRRVEHDV